MKLKSLSLSVLAALSLGVATSSAMANEAVASDAQAYDHSGWWVGAGLGTSWEGDQDDFSKDLDGSAQSVKLEMGYDFSKNWGLFAGYDYMHGFGADLHLGTMGVKGNYYFTDNFSTFGKLGATYIFADDSKDVFKKDSFSGTVGFGLEYQLTNAVSTKIGYDYYQNLELRHGKDTDIHNVYWGITYKFGAPATSKVVTQEVEVVKEIVKEVVVENIVMTRSSYVLPYQTGQVKLNDYGRFNLSEVAATLQANPEMTAEIIGRTDSTGSQAINAKVSKERADAVAQYLIDNGIDASRLAVSGVADQSPLAEANSQKSNLIERSVQIILK